jgi:hypothetical protein
MAVGIDKQAVQRRRSVFKIHWAQVALHYIAISNTYKQFKGSLFIAWRM